MPKLLILNSSPRRERSHSRHYVMKFVQSWAAQHPDYTLTQRDLGLKAVPHITEPWIIGAFAPSEFQTPESEEAIKISNSLVDEFLAADRVIFGVPVYNMNVPAMFKAYIDQIIRVNRTCSVVPGGYAPLVHGKKALFFISGDGALREGIPFGGHYFIEPYLKAIFGFIGLTDTEFVVIDHQNKQDPSAEESRSKVEAAMTELLKSW